MSVRVEERPDTERVAITGYEAITPLGLNVADSVNTLRLGKSGIVKISDVLGEKLIDNEFLKKELVDVGGLVVGFNAEDYLSPTDLRKTHRSAHLIYAAGMRALVQAGVVREVPPPFKGNAEDFIASMFPDSKGNAPKDPTLAERFGVSPDSESLLVNVNPHRAGILLGSGVGGSVSAADIEAKSLYHKAKRALTGLVEEELLNSKLREIFSGEGRDIFPDEKKEPVKSPYWILEVLPDRVLDLLANKGGFRGRGRLGISACASALAAMGDAYEDIYYDHADLMLTGGTEGAMERIGYGSFATMQALNLTDDPTEASRPFFGGNGFVMAEGAGAFVFERMSHAKARGAEIYGEILGWDTRLDGHDDTSPRDKGEGAVITMRLALEAAGISPDEVDLVSTHGTSTPLGDLAELLALLEVFGEEKMKTLPVLSTKGYHGHALGASGAIELAIAMELAREGFLPANWNPNKREPILEGVDLLANGRENYHPRIILKNSFGFGGKNTSMVIAVYPKTA